MTLIFIAYCLISSAKLLRWLALVQQKEYRFDRLASFIKTGEGIGELFLVPQPKQFTRTGLKRPVATLRSLAVALGAAIILIFLILALLQTEGLALFFSAIFLYLSIPLIVAAASLPWSIPAYLWTLVSLNRAKKIIAQAKPLIIGITGSYGKTSTKLLLAELLRSKYRVFTTQRSHNTKFSTALAINRGYRGEEVVILEFAAYKTGEIKELTGYFPPKIALVTGIAPQHFGLFGSVEQIIKAKAELAEAVPADGRVFYNGESRLAAQVCKGAKAKIVKLTLSGLQLGNTALDRRGLLSFEWHRKKITTRLVGKHYLETVLMAAGAASHLGIPETAIGTSLAGFTPPPSFIGVRDYFGNSLMIDDSGTANPQGFEAICNLAKELKKEENILFFGGIVDLGGKSREIHRHLAEISRPLFSRVIYTGSAGAGEFARVFKNDFFRFGRGLEKNSFKTSGESLLVFEGRMPKPVAGYFKLKQ